MNLVKMLRLLQWINEYISLKYCVYDSYWNKWVINKSYISDLAKFNNIIGRMELYVTDKKDKENAVYMLEWFKKEMDARDYIYDDFIDETIKLVPDTVSVKVSPIVRLVGNVVPDAIVGYFIIAVPI